MSLGRTLVLKTAMLRPVESLVRKSFLFRPLVSRFIAGDSLEEAIRASEELLAKGIRVTLDYLGENTRSEAEALDAKRTYVEMLRRISKVPAVVEYARRNHSTYPEGRITSENVEPLNISIKLTQCGLDQGEAFAENNYRDVLHIAAESGNFVRIDMEASEYTERTMNMIDRVRNDFRNTGTVLQSYLMRNDADVQTVIDWQTRTRLVKGAYLEPESVAYPEKSKVDDAYIRQAKKLLLEGNYPAIATQDEKIILELNQFIQDKGIDKSQFEYQMLYGIRRDLQDNLVREGFNVRVYVPFGDAWYPYFTRRLAERPANTLFIVKAMFKG